MPIVKIYSTVSSKLSSLSVRDGNLIFVSDTKQIYLDTNGLRLAYDNIQVCKTEEDRAAILAPTVGFYFVEDKGVLWRYSTYGWKQLTPENLTYLSFGAGEDDLPEEGNPNMLYVMDDAIYKWDVATRTYFCAANKTEWKTM